MVCFFLVIFVVRLLSASVPCNYKYSFVIVLHHENNFIFKYSQLMQILIYQIYIYMDQNVSSKNFKFQIIDNNNNNNKKFFTNLKICTTAKS